jgi:hypothetical protein
MPSWITLALQLLEAAIDEEPAVVAEIQSLFSSGAPTAAQWEAFHTKVASENFGVIPPSSTTTTTTTTTTA